MILVTLSIGLFAVGLALAVVLLRRTSQLRAEAKEWQEIADGISELRTSLGEWGRPNDS